jgi:hypothetical protein
MSPQWHLENVEEASKKAPTTFHIPTIREREALEIGSVVRLHFVPEGEAEVRAERLWVRITRISKSRFCGELLDSPVVISGLSRGAEIAFNKTHIATILISNDDPRWIDCTKFALVTNCVLSRERPIGFLYREFPDSERDSGWRIFAGDEDEVYLNDPANIQQRHLDDVLNMDESLRPILTKPALMAFERAEDGVTFKCVKDFQFGGRP